MPFIVTVLCWFRSPGETPQCRSLLLSCVGLDPLAKPHSAVHCYCLVLVQIPWWNPTVLFIVTVLCWFRSPGGTPLRSLNGPRSPQEPLHKALVMVLRQKFKNARTPSPLTTSSTTSVFSPDATISKNNSFNTTFSPWHRCLYDYGTFLTLMIPVQEVLKRTGFDFNNICFECLFCKCQLCGMVTDLNSSRWSFRVCLPFRAVWVRDCRKRFAAAHV